MIFQKLKIIRLKTLRDNIKAFGNSQLFANSFWGITSIVIQNIFLAVFFIILARKYQTDDFAQFLIANTLYQLVAIFSALGLGAWFVREIINTSDKTDFTTRFLKIQLLFGIIFFFINIALTYVIYDNHFVHLLSILLGVNIVFDNLIYSIKHINIAEFHQKKTFKILTIESFAKLVVGCLLFLYPFSIVTLTIILVIIRFATLSLFLKLASTEFIRLNRFWKSKVTLRHVKELIYNNWYFVVIGGVSVVYWRIASVFVAKILSLVDVANYEISFKIFSIAQIMPMAVSATVFPILVKMYNKGDTKKFQNLYQRMFKVYALFGILAFTFIYTFADPLLPFLFGDKYSSASLVTIQMFLTMLIFPTAFLQANVLIAMKLERFDMWLNIASLAVHVIICLVGLHFIKSIEVVTISLFISFTLFHLLQDFLLIRKRITRIADTILFYVLSVLIIYPFILLFDYFQSYWIPVLTWCILIFIFSLSLLKSSKGVGLMFGSIQNRSKK